MTRDVVVTGVGAVSALGVGREALWKSALEGIHPEPIHPEGPEAPGCLSLEGFDPAPILERKGIRYLGPGTRYVASAGRLALEDAGFADPDGLGFVLGSAFGNTPETFHFTHRSLANGVGNVSPMASFDAALNSQANYTAVFLEARCFNKAICSMTASLEALVDAAEMVRAGRAVAVLAAGVEYWSIDLARWIPLERPEWLSTPILEGAFALLLEDREHASARGARILAEVGRGACGFDGGGAPGRCPGRVAGSALGHERPDRVVLCGSEPPAVVPALAGAPVLRLRDIVRGEALGARGALAALLTSLSLGEGLAPGGGRCGAGRVLLLDYEPGASTVALLLRGADAAREAAPC